MAAGVMRDARAPGSIETAGIELDRTLLAYDYLNGEPLSCAGGLGPRPDRPIGGGGRLRPRGVPLGRGLRREDLRLPGGRRPRPAAAARGRPLPAREGCAWRRTSTPRRSAPAPPARTTWRVSVVAICCASGAWSRARRLPAVLLREIGQAAVQSAMDRNLGPVRGRVKGLRAGRPSESYPSPRGAREPAVAVERGPAPLAQAGEAPAYEPPERLRTPASRRFRRIRAR